MQTDASNFPVATAGAPAVSVTFSHGPVHAKPAGGQNCKQIYRLPYRRRPGCMGELFEVSSPSGF